MAVVLALVSALAYGTSDFLGGLISRRTSAWAVAVVVQVSAAVSTTAAAAVLGGSPTSTDLAWAALAGAGSGLGVVFLFRGFADGRMSVVAPLSAVGAALVPVAVGLALGERPGLLAAIGLVVAFPGIWLVAGGEGSASDGDRVRRGSGVLDGLLAGAGFGTMFAALGQVDQAAGLWPVAATQGFSAVVAAALAIVLGSDWRPRAATLRSAPAGVLSSVAVVCFQLAAQTGLLTVSSVLTSLYPAATILLAVSVLGEQIRWRQAAGLALCGLTVGLVAAG